MKIIKTLLTAAVLAGVVSTASAQRLTAAWAFTNVPTSLMPSIAPDTRLDMVDYANSGAYKACANELDGVCRITELTAERIVVKTSDVGTWELDLLPYRGDTIYMVLSTVLTPAPDTSVRFYDRGWSPLKARLFEAPGLDDFIAVRKLPAGSRADIENAIPFVMRDISYDPAGRVLTVRQVFDRYVPEDEYDAVRGMLLPELTYRYNGKKFVVKR